MGKVNAVAAGIKGYPLQAHGLPFAGSSKP